MSPQTVTVDYATSDGTATAGSDYVTASGTLTFSPGIVTRQATVTVNGDGVNEPDERYFFNLSDVTDASVGDPYAVGTIADDDGGVILVRGLAHGARARDGFAGGADLYSMDVPARTSWEVVVDEASGDASNGGPLLQRVGTDTTSVLQTSTAAGTGTARTLSWRNTTGLPQLAYVRIASSQCTTGCGPDDTYRVRAYETTLQVPRFNNSGNQVTILVLQNPSSATISGTAYFWGTAGALLGQHSFTLAARASTVVATSGVAGVAGQIGLHHHRARRALRRADRQVGGPGVRDRLQLRRGGGAEDPLAWLPEQGVLGAELVDAQAAERRRSGAQDTPAGPVAQLRGASRRDTAGQRAVGFERGPQM